MSIIDVIAAVYKTEHLYCFKQMFDSSKNVPEDYMAFLCNVSSTLMEIKSQGNQIAGIFLRQTKVRTYVHTSKLAF